MITKTNYGPCENLHAVAPDEVPPATHLVQRELSPGIVSALYVCEECADRYEMQGWVSEPLRSEEESDMPYREEWEAIYGNLNQSEFSINPEGFDPF